MKSNLKVVQNGRSFYVLLPQEIVKYYSLASGEKIQVDIEKFVPTTIKMISEFQARNKEITCKLGDKELSGKIESFDYENVVLFNQEKNISQLIPLSLIQEIWT